MLDNRHEAVSSDGCTDLYSDSVLCSSPELLDLKVLLEPLEEKLYLPSVLVEVGYLLAVKSIALVRNMNSLSCSSS